MADEQSPITNPVEALVTYFVSRLRRRRQPMGRTKLVKLLYFADLYHLELFGSRITEIPYRHYYAGPYSEQVSDAVARLEEKGIFVEREHTTRDGRKAYILSPTVKTAKIRLVPSAKEIADIVLEEWGPTGASEIEAAAKRTVPFMRAAFNELIDLANSSVDEFYQEQQGLSSPSAAATELIAQDAQLLAQIREPDKKPATR